MGNIAFQGFQVIPGGSELRGSHREFKASERSRGLLEFQTSFKMFQEFEEISQWNNNQNSSGVGFKMDLKQASEDAF